MLARRERLHRGTIMTADSRQGVLHADDAALPIVSTMNERDVLQLRLRVAYGKAVRNRAWNSPLETNASSTDTRTLCR